VSPSRKKIRKTSFMAALTFGTEANEPVPRDWRRGA
jgi:hypothetical protein